MSIIECGIHKELVEMNRYPKNKILELANSKMKRLSNCGECSHPDCPNCILLETLIRSKYGADKDTDIFLSPQGAVIVRKILPEHRHSISLTFYRANNGVATAQTVP